MKIDLIEVTPFSVTLRRPVVFATGQLTAAEHVLIRVRTSDGVVGSAEAIPRPMVYGETIASVCEAMSQMIGPAVLGMCTGEIGQLPHRLRNVIGNPTVKAAVELALYDALGHELGVPCWRLLGGFTSRPRCTVLLGWEDPHLVAEQATAAHEQLGVDSFKLKVGMALDQDVAIVDAVRSAVGDSALIYADANHGYSAREATQFLERTRDARLAWFEEPCPDVERLARQRLCRLSAIPVVGDESCTTPAEVSDALLDGRSSMVSIKTARTAILGSGRIRDFCQTVGVEVLTGSQGETGLGTLAAAAFTASTEWSARLPAELLYFLDFESDLLTESPLIADGRLHLPEAPGFGAEIDEVRLQHASLGPSLQLRL